MRQITEGLASYLRDESGLVGSASRAFFPGTGEEAAEVVRLAIRAGEKLTFQGARTGLTGGAVPQTGWLLNFSEMKKLGKPENGHLWAEAGATLEDVGKAAAGAGLFFPPDPTEGTATLGGMFASGGGGPGGLRYGPASRWIRRLQWLTPEGKILEIERGQYRITGGQLALPGGKEADVSELLKIHPGAPEDLVDFLFGSGGRLGAVLSLELALLPVPKDRWGILFFFRAPEQIFDFGHRLRAVGETLTAAEFFDGAALEFLTAHRNHPLLSGLPAFPARCAVYVQLEGASEEETGPALEALLDSFEACGGGEADTWAENTPGAIAKFRALRHGITAIVNEEAGIRRETDFAIPGGLPEKIYADMQKELAASGLHGLVYGHLLTSHLHLALLPEGQACGELVRKLTEKAVRAGGIPAAEYGAGRLQREMYMAVLPEPARKNWEARCRMADPNGILRP